MSLHSSPRLAPLITRRLRSCPASQLRPLASHSGICLASSSPHSVSSHPSLQHLQRRAFSCSPLPVGFVTRESMLTSQPPGFVSQQQEREMQDAFKALSRERDRIILNLAKSLAKGGEGAEEGVQGIEKALKKRMEEKFRSADSQLPVPLIDIPAIRRVLQPALSSSPALLATFRSYLKGYKRRRQQDALQKSNKKGSLKAGAVKEAEEVESDAAIRLQLQYLSDAEFASLGPVRPSDQDQEDR